jgi:hypothetical protein
MEMVHYAASLTASLSSSPSDSDNKECSICMDSYNAGERMKRLPCTHVSGHVCKHQSGDC